MTDDPAEPDPGRTKALRRDAAENRERLLRAAWEAFAELGPEAGVDEIARRAGVGTGTLYRRFPTKDALIVSLHQGLMEELLGGARRALEENPPGGGLESYLWHAGALIAGRQGCLSQLWRTAGPGIQERRDELWRLVDRLLHRAREAGRVREDLTLTDVYLCVLSLRGLIEEVADRAPDAWRRHLELLLAGFRPDGSGPVHPPADESLVWNAVCGGRPDRPPADRTTR